MPFKRRKSSKGMQNRISKLEKQMIPIVKTFEQRQFDYTSAVTAGLPGYALSHASSAAWTMNSLCSTIQDAGTTAWSAGTVRIGDKITLKSLSIKGEGGTIVLSEILKSLLLYCVNFQYLILLTGNLY